MDDFKDWADTLLTIFFVLVALMMTFLILLQEGKGGGLAALGGTKAAGVEGVTNPIRRATAYLAGIFFLLAIGLGILHKPKKLEFVGENAKPAENSMGGAANKPAGINVNPQQVKMPKPPPPVHVQPKIDVKPEVPKTEVKTEAPKAEVKTEVKTEAPKTEEKKTEAPKPETKAEEKKTEEKKTDAPKTEEKK